MNNGSLQSKLAKLSLSLIGLSIGVGLVGLIGTMIMAHDYKQIANVNLPIVSDVNKMFIEMRRVRVNAVQLGVEGADAKSLESSYDGIKRGRAGYAEVVAAYKAVPFESAEEDKIFGEFNQLNQEVLKKVERVEELSRANLEWNDPGRAELRSLILKDILTLSRESETYYDQLENYHMKFSANNVRAASVSEWVTLLLTVVMIFAGGLAGWIFSQRFSESLVRALTAVSAALNEAGSQVSSAATQISASSQQLSSASTQQASSLAETAASIEEMNSMVAKNNENSHSAARVSEEARATAARGQEGVAHMVASMDEIAASNAQVAEIVKVIREIGEKTKVINDIVFQTKLLSFNASKEIAMLLEASLAKVELIVGETKRKVDAGTATAHESGAILAEIVENVSRVASMAGEISTASEEQSAGVGEITKAMNQLDQVTQQNAQSSEEAASAATQLSAQAESLNGLVGELMALVDGGVSAQGHGALAPVSFVRKTVFKKQPAQPRSNVISLDQARKTKAQRLAAGQTSLKTPGPIASNSSQV